VAGLKDAYLIADDDPDEAARACNDILRDDPDNAAAMYLLGTIHARAERYGNALALFERCTKIAPHRHEAWNNLGMVWQECHDFDKSRENFKRALAIKEQAGYLANIGSSYSGAGNYAEAIRWCKKALKIDPDHDGAHTTLGFAQIATGDWLNGWKGYEHCLGGRFRKIVQIGDEPKWDGSPVDSLFVYGEQGIGDEIMYASCLNDIKNVGQITLECDPRLEGLFKRSFPHIEVHGTRRKAQVWAAGRTFAAGCGIGSLPALYRPTRESCPKTPYLTADPERRLQWRALLDSFGRKPKIGLCWTGGRAATQRKQRNVGVDALAPLLSSVDADWFSLQYTDPGDEIKGTPIKHYHRATQSPDFDDTAALIAELDMVVGIHTTAHHMAGALGVPSLILVPSQPMWLYAYGDSLPWYPDQRLHRQRKNEKWIDCVRRIDMANFGQWKEAA
jgi:hypothetical protein